ERVLKRPLLEGHLRLGIDMLGGATAADPEVGAARANAAAAFAVDRDHLCHVEARLAAHQAGAHRFAGQAATHEHHLAVAMGDAVAVEVERFDPDGDKLGFRLPCLQFQAARYSAQWLPSSVSSVRRNSASSPRYSSGLSWQLMSW